MKLLNINTINNLGTAKIAINKLTENLKELFLATVEIKEYQVYLNILLNKINNLPLEENYILAIKIADEKTPLIGENGKEEIDNKAESKITASLLKEEIINEINALKDIISSMLNGKKLDSDHLNTNPKQSKAFLGKKMTNSKTNISNSLEKSPFSMQDVQLPDDVSKLIFSKLSNKYLLNTRLVNKKFKEIADNFMPVIKYYQVDENIIINLTKLYEGRSENKNHKGLTPSEIQAYLSKELSRDKIEPHLNRISDDAKNNNLETMPYFDNKKIAIAIAPIIIITIAILYFLKSNELSKKNASPFLMVGFCLATATTMYCLFTKKNILTNCLSTFHAKNVKRKIENDLCKLIPTEKDDIKNSLKSLNPKP